MKSRADSTSSNAALLLCELLKATIRDGPLSRANPRFWITSAYLREGKSGWSLQPGHRKGAFMGIAWLGWESASLATEPAFA